MIDLTEAIVFVERYCTDLRWEGVHEMVCGECAACSVSRALQKARQDQRRQEATIAALLAVPDDIRATDKRMGGPLESSVLVKVDARMAAVVEGER